MRRIDGALRVLLVQRILIPKGVTWVSFASFHHQTELRLGIRVKADDLFIPVLNHPAGFDAVSARGDAGKAEAAFFVRAGCGDGGLVSGVEELDEHALDGGADVRFTRPAGEFWADRLVDGLWVVAFLDLSAFRTKQV